MGNTAIGQPHFASTEPELQAWITRVGQYLTRTAELDGGSLGVPPAGAVAGVQAWTGLNKFLGGTAEQNILGLGIPVVKVSRTAPQSSGVGINNALTVLELVPQNCQSIEWTQLNRLLNQSDFGSNVAFYAQAYKSGKGATWSGVFESQDTSGDPNSALIGIEIDVCFNGVDTLSRKLGIAIVYGDAAPNTLNPAGPVVSVGNLIQCDPFSGIARFHALSALRTNGTYTNAALDLSGLKNTPFALDIAGGCHILLHSGTAGYTRPYIYPNVAYVPVIVGGIEVDIDGLFYWIPFANNMP